MPISRRDLDQLTDALLEDAKHELLWWHGPPKLGERLKDTFAETVRRFVAIHDEPQPTEDDWESSPGHPSEFGEDR